MPGTVGKFITDIDMKKFQNDIGMTDKQFNGFVRFLLDALKEAQEEKEPCLLYTSERHTPKVRWSKACNACSLKEICLPVLGKKKSASDYIQAHLEEKS